MLTSALQSSLHTSCAGLSASINTMQPAGLMTHLMEGGALSEPFSLRDVPPKSTTWDFLCKPAKADFSRVPKLWVKASYDSYLLHNSRSTSLSNTTRGCPQEVQKRCRTSHTNATFPPITNNTSYQNNRAPWAGYVAAPSSYPFTLEKLQACVCVWSWREYFPSSEFLLRRTSMVWAYIILVTFQCDINGM